MTSRWRHSDSDSCRCIRAALWVAATDSTVSSFAAIRGMTRSPPRRDGGGSSGDIVAVVPKSGPSAFGRRCSGATAATVGGFAILSSPKNQILVTAAV